MWVFEFSNIGPVYFCANKRAKRIGIRVGRNSKISVTIPSQLYLQQAKAFVEDRTPWILQVLQKQAARVSQSAVLEDTPNITKHHSLLFASTRKSAPYARIANQVIHIFVPSDFDKRDVALQVMINKSIEQALCNEARRYMSIRVQELAVQHNFSFSRIRISRAKTRWGSCSSVNTISFSCYIMKLPVHLIDFIIVHELCHTVHKNHGELFHQLLERCMQGSKKMCEQEMRRYRIH